MKGTKKDRDAHEHGEVSSTRPAYNHNKYRKKKLQRRYPHQHATRAGLFKGNSESLKRHVYTYNGLARALSSSRPRIELSSGKWRTAPHVHKMCRRPSRTCQSRTKTYGDQTLWLIQMTQCTKQSLIKKCKSNEKEASISEQQHQSVYYYPGPIFASQRIQAWGMRRLEKHEVETRRLEAVQRYEISSAQSVTKRSPQGISAYKSVSALFKKHEERLKETAEYRKRFKAAKEILEHGLVTFGVMFQRIANDALNMYYKKLGPLPQTHRRPMQSLRLKS